MRLTEQNVKEVIIDASMQKAVFVYFYMNAPECEKTTTAIKAAINDNNEYVSLVEADVSEQVGQAIAMQLGLQSVPALIVMQQGRPVDALQGDDILTKLTDLLNKYMPSEADLLVKEALDLENNNALADALIKITSAYNLDPKDVNKKLIYARICIKNKSLEKAHELLDNPGRELSESQDYKDLVSALTLAEQVAESPEIKELEQKYLNDPTNVEIVTSYAAALSQLGKRAKALEILFNILKQDLNNDVIKKTFLDLLNTMAGDPLQKEYRRKLYTLMY